jgi:ribonuclease D
MDRPALRKEGPEIVAAVQAGLDAPEEELPALVALVRHDDPPQVALLGQLLAILANSLAAESQVAGSMLATAADLQEFIRWRLGLSDREPQLMTGWRGEILGQPLVELLEGKRYVHVADANSPNPLRITRFEAE